MKYESFAYTPPFFLRNGHALTMYPVLFRDKPALCPVRERILTPDGDFLDIDWHRQNSDRIAVISHGLEGNSRRKYVLGAAKALLQEGWDVVCLNFRGCSGEPNLLLREYHSGVTDDLDTVLRHALKTGGYSRAGLIGFSMGGNQTLKYLGENPGKVPQEVVCAAVFSVPCHLSDAARTMGRAQNAVYMEYFLRGLREKVRRKAERFPEAPKVEGLMKIRTFHEFDDRFTAPTHGFADAEDYYARCSAVQFLGEIAVPTLLVNALDDPFLSESCYPVAAADENPYLRLETPRHGGHVGFVSRDPDGLYWSERRMAAWFSRYAP